MKLREVADQSEWENVPYVMTKTPNYKALQLEKNKRLRALRNQDDIIANRYIALEDKFPNEIKSRGVPDDNDMQSDFMNVPAEVDANPEAWTTIECPGRWLYDDMQQNDACSPHEEFYILKASPRHQLVVNMLERHKQISRLKQRPWPPVRNETT
jgi:hypothetical protein